MRHFKQRIGLTALLIVLLAVLGASATSLFSDVVDAGDPTDSLTAEYRFEESGGETVYDYSGNGRNGSVNDATWSDGLSGLSLSLDGSNDFVSFQESLHNPEEGALSFWANADSSSAGETRLIYLESSNTNSNGGGSGGSENDFSLEYAPSDEFKFAFEAAGDYRKTLLHPVEHDEWQHWTVTWKDGGEIRLYLNGKLVKEKTVTDGAFTSFASKTEIGRAFSDERYFDGRLDDMKLYNVKLNQSQINSLYKRGSTSIGTQTRYEKHKMLEIGFDKKNSTHVFDSSGNNNFGSIEGTAKQTGSLNCKVGRCFEFDNNGDYVNISDDSSLDYSNDSLTISGWFYPISQRFDYADIMDATSTIEFSENITELRFQVDGGVGVCKSGLGFLEKSDWTHATFTYENGKGSKMYKNGRLYKQCDNSGTIDNSEKHILINAERGGKGMEGRMDQVKIFDKALTPVEVAENTGLESDAALIDLRFDTGTGDTAYDSSVYGHDADVSPNETFGPDWTEGLRGNGMRFDGSDDYVEVPANSVIDEVMDNSTSYSKSIWFKTDSNVDPGRLIYKRNGLTYNNGKVIATRHDINNNYCKVDSLSIYDDNDWHHAAWTWDSGNLSLYMDGGYIGSCQTAQPRGNDSGQPVVVGANSWAKGQNFEGKVDEPRVYPYTLTAEKVNEIYNAGAQNFGDPTDTDYRDLETDEGRKVAEYGFNTGDASTAFDSSFNQNHGTYDNIDLRDSSECVIGKCIYFSGDQNDGVDVPHDSSLDITEELTVSMWMKSYQDEQGDYSNVINKNAFSNNMFHIVDEGSGRTTFRIGINSTDYEGDVSTTDAINYGEWTHFVFRYDPVTGDMTTFSNGRLDSTENIGDITPINTNTNELEMGKGGAEKFKGYLDEIKIINESISDQEIWKLYTQGRDQLGSTEKAGPTGHWRMSERGYLHDYSGENNHADSHVVGEVGTFNTSDGEWTRVDFKQIYRDPVVVGTSNTNAHGGSGLIVQARNVGNGSAEMRLCNYDVDTQTCQEYATERVGYMVIDKESANKASGLEAGTISSSGSFVGDGNVSFSESFSSPPVVLATVQTAINGEGINARMESVTSSDIVDLGICLQSANDDCSDTTGTETVGYIALESGNMPFSTASDSGSVTVGGGGTYETVSLSGFGDSPVVLAHTQSRNGNQNNLITESRNVNSSYAQVRSCELDSDGTCDGHSNENVGWFAASDSVLSIDTSSGNWPQWENNCVIGGCYSFDGDDDEILVENIDNLPSGTGSYTVSMWMKTETAQTNDAFIWGTQSSNSFTGLMPRFGGDVRFILGGGNDLDGTPPESYNNGEWHHLVGVHNDSASQEMRLYYDGELLGTKAGEPNLGNTKASIGAKWGTATHFEGSLDDIRVYPYALTTEQVREIRSQGLSSIG